MFRIFNTITSDILDYEDVEDFRKSSKFAFDESVHGAIDRMCDAYKRGKNIESYELFLAIRVVSDYTLDVYDLMDLYR